MEPAITGTTRTATQRFSTDVFPPRERVPVWRELFGQTIAKLEFEPLSDGPLRAEATLCKFPGFGLVTMATETMRFDKTRSLIDNDDVVLGMVDTGGWSGAQMGREAHLDPGDAVLCSNSEVAVGRSFGRRTVLRVPVSALASMVPNVDATVLRRIPAKSPALRLLRSYVAALQDAPTTPDIERLSATHVYDLLAITLGATRDAAEVAKARGGQAARLHAVTAGIEEHLTNPALSAAWLGVKLGLSERYVHHLLADTGSSFSELVRRKRVKRARRMLEQPSVEARRIIDVAYAVGFADLSSFNRAFRRQFGCTPSDVQRSC